MTLKEKLKNVIIIIVIGLFFIVVDVGLAGVILSPVVVIKNMLISSAGVVLANCWTAKTKKELKELT